MRYSVSNYKIPRHVVKDLMTLESHRTYRAVAEIWIVIGLTVFGSIWLKNHHPYLFWSFYPLIGFMIAGRQGALLQIVHEGSHKLISNHRATNDFVGDWLAALPTGLNLSGYTTGHMQHHAHTNTDRDLPTDLAKHEVVDLRDPRLYQLFLADIVGWTAVKSFFGHSGNAKRKGEEAGAGQKRAWVRIALVQLLIFAALFQFNFVNYILLWAIPVMTFNMVLLRVRGIVEHGLPRQRGMPIEFAEQGNLYTRTVLPDNARGAARVLRLFERFFIGSLSCNYHHEHHLLPKVPFYRLRQLHGLIQTEVHNNNSDVYVDSYFKAFLLGQHSG
jgi:fatty acid desaturase